MKLTKKEINRGVIACLIIVGIPILLGMNTKYVVHVSLLAVAIVGTLIYLKKKKEEDKKKEKQK